MNKLKKGSLLIGTLAIATIPAIITITNNQTKEIENSSSLMANDAKAMSKQLTNQNMRTKLVEFDQLKTGDFFVQFETHDKITDLVNHAGFIEKVDNDHVRIFESMPDIGVDYRRDSQGNIMLFDEVSFTQRLIEDQFIILRAQVKTKDVPWWEIGTWDEYGDANGQRAFSYAKSYMGTPYDWDFDKDDQSEIYCSELIWKAFLNQGIDLDYAPPLPLPWIVMPTELWMDEEAKTLFDYRDF